MTARVTIYENNNFHIKKWDIIEWIQLEILLLKIKSFSTTKQLINGKFGIVLSISLFSNPKINGGLNIIVYALLLAGSWGIICPLRISYPI